jgi:transcriptional antiterminator NusG
MSNSWYIVKVLPGKERQLTEQFNQQIELKRIKNITRFVCPTEKELVLVKNKKVTREKVIYGGYLYFESPKRLSEDDLKEIASIPNIMGMMGDRKPVLLREEDVRRILKDEALDEHMESKKIKFKVGELVKISEGAFSSFDGVISEITGDKVFLEVKIFGRDTHVELTLSQIQKI